MPDVISPKGLQQSTRMRNMRVLFDGPAPSGTIKITSDQPKARPSSGACSQAMQAQEQGSPLCAQFTADMPLSARSRADTMDGSGVCEVGHEPLRHLPSGVNVPRKTASERAWRQAGSKGRPAASPKIDIRSIQVSGVGMGLGMVCTLACA
jgi:hypothetical protein